MLLTQKSIAMPLSFAFILLAGLAWFQYFQAPFFSGAAAGNVSRAPRKTLWEYLRKPAPEPPADETGTVSEVLLGESGANAWRTIEGPAAPSFLDARLEGDEPVRADDGRILFDFGARDTTGMRDVRTTNVMLGVGYRVSQSGALGVEASKEFRDEGDASLAGHSPETEETMSVRYRYKF